MTKLFRFGGYLASTVLILFGLGATVLGTLGFMEVRDTIARENITATPDAAEIEGVNLEPGEEINTGGEAKEFAEIIRTHALEATGGRAFAEIPRYLTETGEETNDESAAATQDGRPVENPTRSIWNTATAFTTALNTAYLAEQIALFTIAMGAALVLVGVGFLVLTIAALRSPVFEREAPAS